MSRGPVVIERTWALESDKLWVELYLQKILEEFFSLLEPQFPDLCHDMDARLS